MTRRFMITRPPSPGLTVVALALAPARTRAGGVADRARIRATSPRRENAMVIAAAQKYCPICGEKTTEPTFGAFAEWACADAHPDDAVKEARGQPLRAAAPVVE